MQTEQNTILITGGGTGIGRGGSSIGGGLSGSGFSFNARPNRRSSTSRIMAKSSPGVSEAERILNFRYWPF